MKRWTRPYRRWRRAWGSARACNPTSGLLLRATPTQKSPPSVGFLLVGRDYMFSIMTWPKPEHETWVAPSIRRAKSYVTFFDRIDFSIELMIKLAASVQP